MYKQRKEHRCNFANIITNNTMWSIIFMFNEFDGMPINQTFIQ